ncbi:xyloglucan endotransglucosylase/hydrolase protein 2-like [Rutidosis leptorrhynchoides]|uniref:xyloglucan endotransglucosylase/hydrolase protein 2-like n=1 Tax=Rutidosis leptorrhynchoides TaxID=125765 RepID=UPI003A9A157B
MGFSLKVIATILLLALFGTMYSLCNGSRDESFDENYNVIWGNQHVSFLNQRREIQLLLDISSGAGFASKAFYASGFFQMKIKTPDNMDTAGIVTAFYLFINSTVHDELDFEFMGDSTGKPTKLQTNVFTNGVGGREQKYVLWFDPSADFHYYKFLWNQHQAVFYVDDIPIRVYKNNMIKGLKYPNNTMQVIVSLWDGSDWATDGGQTKANYSYAPFLAHFQDFSIDGCVSLPNEPNADCYSQKFWWNSEKHWQLNSQQLDAYEDAKKYMIYDYCRDRIRYPIPPIECSG